MNSVSGILVVLTGLINVALNVLVRNAAVAHQGRTYVDMLKSQAFGLAFLVGISSLLCLAAVHRSELNLAQAIALMGSVSIVGGSLYGIARGNTMSPVEWILVALIAVLFLYRWFAPLIGQS